MKRLTGTALLFALAALTTLSRPTVADKKKPKPSQTVTFRKVKLSDERYEAAGVLDINGDGKPDIASGAYWYEGPEFTTRHKIGEVKAQGEYFDDFAAIPLDVNGDGRMDIATGGWWGKALKWRENPGDPTKEWAVHTVAQTGNVETARAWDVDGDGVVELVPNTPGGPLAVYRLVTDAQGKGTGTFETHKIYGERQGHGLGFGDLNGDGRGDFVLAKGWLEAPEDRYAGTWAWHPEFNLGHASIPMVVTDVNGDGLNDILVGQGHGYGLDWWEQKREGDQRRWVRHPIDPFCSQYHDMIWVDIDGDGKNEIVTGKRYRAHCGNDPGASDPVGVYYFKWTGESFAKQFVDFGPPDKASGVGIQFAVADLNGDGLLDIVAPGKEGLYAFFNEGRK